MTNPFDSRIVPLNGPARDIQPITPADGIDLMTMAVALYIETGGTLTFVTEAGATRIVTLPDHTVLPVGTRQVHATGTTASGIHALVIQ